MKKAFTFFCLLMILMLLCGFASAATLKKGASGFDVQALNMRLNALGYNTDIESFVYDNTTLSAVKSFQKDRGLKVTGSVNEDTWSELFNEKYKLNISLDGIASRDYYMRGRLTAPFTVVEVQDSTAGYKNTAKMKIDNFECQVTLKIYGSFDECIKAIQDTDKSSYNDTFKTKYKANNLQTSGNESYTIRGKKAQVWSQTWNYVNEVKLVRYIYRGVVELDKVEGKQLFASVYMSYNIQPDQKVITEYMGLSVVRDVLNNIRCDKDRLSDYQTDAAKRKKVSKLKLTLPEFQPVDEKEQTLLEIVYTIRDSAVHFSDGSSGKLDGSTCVSMYYGAKIMQSYIDNIKEGNKPSDAMTLCLLSVSSGFFDNGFIATLPTIRERLHTVLTAAALALKKENAAYLVLLGIDTPEWNEDDLNKMDQKLTNILDKSISRNYPSVNSVRFDTASVEVGKAAGIIAVTSVNADKLCMYAGDTLIQTWTDEYMDDGSVRTWNVSYAFKGKGNRTLRFRAGNDSGMGLAVDASVNVTDRITVPVISDVIFSTSAAAVGTPVRIVAVTSTDTEKLCMYADDKLVKTWTAGYTDKSSARTWNVEYAFSGKGNRTLSFRAVKSGAQSKEINASIVIVDADSVPLIYSVVFSKDSVKQSEDVGVIAVTTVDADKLCMYLDGKLVRTWTAGYTDRDFFRTWNVKYAFTGKGNRTLTFMAERGDVKSSEINASITVTDAVSIPVLFSAVFNSDVADVEEKVSIIAVSSVDAEILSMYSGDKRVRTWTTSYTDRDSRRIWNVSYAFKGKGNRKFTFRVENSAGISLGVDADILIR